MLTGVFPDSRAEPMCGAVNMQVDARFASIKHVPRLNFPTSQKAALKFLFPSGQFLTSAIEGLHPRRKLNPCPGSSGVEQWIENPRVGGSIPPPGTTSLRNCV